MIPCTIPEEMRKKFNISSAEIRIFNELKALPDEYTCVWSVPWADTAHSLKSGEADFIIIHPKFPLTIVEAKAGKLSCRNGYWSRYARDGEQYAESPIDQAHKSREYFVKKFSRMPGIPDGRFIPNAAVVMLPDTFRTSLVGDSGYYEFVLTAEDFSDFEQRLETTMRIRTDKLNRFNNGIGIENANFMTKYFSVQPSNQIPMRSLIDLDQKEIAKISREHYLTIAQLEHEKNILISGRAGTGKTVLAIQKTVLEAQQKRQTLLVCFNEYLANSLQEQINAYSKTVKESVTCVSFHQLCRIICEKASDLPNEEEKNQKEYLDDLEFTAECVVLHDLKIGNTYDSIVVDEGQDFKESWWKILKALKVKNNEGCFWVFLDEFQSVQQESSFPLESFFRFSLLKNFRNSQSVFKLIAQSDLDRYIDRTLPVGPIGANCKLVATETKAEIISNLEKEVKRLIENERVNIEEIVVLSGLGLDNSENSLFKRKKINDFQIARGPVTRKNELFVESIRRYKGLESKYVILVEIDNHTPENIELEKKLIYVGCTRAVSGLTILAKKKTFDRLGWYLSRE